jgi:ABC-type multidrug transport system fused ATPase/permease subunit
VLVVRPLFRREVLASRNTAAYGTVLLGRNRAYRWLCLLFGGTAAALALFVGWASYARTATVGGVVLPPDGVQRVVAAANGRVTALLVSEGQAVARGQSLLAMGSVCADARSASADRLQIARLTVRRDSLQTELLRLRKVCFRYADGRSRVLRDLDLHIPAGQFVAITGAWGCGKSTLLSLLLGWYPPTGGDID